MSTMSMDRYFTIRFPFKCGRNKTRKFMLLKVISVWLLSAIICGPVFILGLIDPINVYDDITKMCTLTNSNFKIYGSILAFYIPLIIIAVTYLFTMYSLKKLMKNKETIQINYKNQQTQHTQSTTDSYLLFAVNHENNKKSKKSYYYYNYNLNLKNLKLDISTLNEINSKQYCSMNNMSENFNKSKNSMAAQDGITIKNTQDNKNGKPTSIQTFQNLEKNLNEENSKSTTKKSSSILFSNNKVISILNKVYDKNESKSIIDIISSRILFRKKAYKNLITQSQSESKINDTKLNHKRNNYIINYSMDNFEEIFNLDKKRLTKTKKKLFNLDYNLNSSNKNFINKYELVYELKNYENNTSKLKILSNSNSSELSSSYASNIINNSHIEESNKIQNELNCIENEMDNYLCGYTKDFEDNVFLDDDEITKKGNLIQEKELSNNDIKRKCNLLVKQDSFDISEDNCLSYDFKDNENNTSILNKKFSGNTIEKTAISDLVLLDNKVLANDTLKTDAVSKKTINGDKNKERRNFSMQKYRHHLNFSTLQNRRRIFLKHKSLSNTTTTNSSDVILKRNSGLFSDSTRICFSNIRINKANNERKALKVLVIIFVIFVSLWTPFFIVTLISGFCENCEFITPDLILIITWLGYISSMANPIIYTMFNKSFRKAFLNLLKCRTNRSENLFLRDNYLVYKTFGKISKRTA